RGKGYGGTYDAATRQGSFVYNAAVPFNVAGSLVGGDNGDRSFNNLPMRVHFQVTAGGDFVLTSLESADPVGTSEGFPFIGVNGQNVSGSCSGTLTSEPPVLTPTVPFPDPPPPN